MGWDVIFMRVKEVLHDEHQQQTRAKDESTEESQLRAHAEKAATASRTRASRNSHV
jgi:hypothetical protein